MHIFWAEKEARGEKREWEDAVVIVWQDVRGMCGFWEGSCRAIGSGERMWEKMFSRALGWHTVNNKCEHVPKKNALDVEISGCEILIECMGEWIDRCSV